MTTFSLVESAVDATSAAAVATAQRLRPAPNKSASGSSVPRPTWTPQKSHANGPKSISLSPSV